MELENVELKTNEPFLGEDERCRPVVNNETGWVFASSREAGEAINRCRHSIHRALNGITKKCGQYTWRYLEEAEYKKVKYIPRTESQKRVNDHLKNVKKRQKWAEYRLERDFKDGISGRRGIGWYLREYDRLHK